MVVGHFCLPSQKYCPHLKAMLNTYFTKKYPIFTQIAKVCEIAFEPPSPASYDLKSTPFGEACQTFLSERSFR